MSYPPYGTQPIECPRCGWRGYETDLALDPVGTITYHKCPECDYGSYVFLADDEATACRPAREAE